MRALKSTNTTGSDVRSLVRQAVGTGFGVSGAVVRTISALADTAAKSPSGRRPRPTTLRWGAPLSFGWGFRTSEPAPRAGSFASGTRFH